MLVLLFVALWFILRGDLLYVFPCVILFLYFSVLLVLRLPRLGKRELILVLFVRLFGLCLFRFVGFLFLLGSGKGCVCDCGTPWTFLLPFVDPEKLQRAFRKLKGTITSFRQQYKSFDFSTLYTTIPHDKLKSKSTSVSLVLQPSLLLMKSLNKTEIPIFLSVVCSLFPKAIFLTFILLHCSWY